MQGGVCFVLFIPFMVGSGSVVQRGGEVVGRGLVAIVLTVSPGV